MFYRFFNGINLRKFLLTLVLLLCAGILFVLMQIWQFNQEVAKLSALSVERQQCDDAISDLIEGSDYLTTNIWFYVTTNEVKYMNKYWLEVNVTKSRDNAMAKLNNYGLAQNILYQAEKAKSESDALINLELWAMRMISEANMMSLASMPTEVAAYKLDKNDAGLSPDAKRQKAIDYIYGSPYRNSKQRVVFYINEFRSDLIREFNNTSAALGENISEFSTLSNIGIFVVFCISAILLFLYIKLFERPLNKFKQDLLTIQKSSFTSDIPQSKCADRQIRNIIILTNSILAELRERNAALTLLSETDNLTLLPNRRRLSAFIESHMAVENSFLSLLFMELDAYDEIVKQHSQAMGDCVLEQFAQILASVTAHYNPDGIAGRYTNSKFMIILPQISLSDAYGIADTIRDRVNAKQFICHSNVQKTFTSGCSIALVTSEYYDNCSVADLIKQALHCLREAREQGGNVCVHLPPTHIVSN